MARVGDGSAAVEVVLIRADGAVIGRLVGLRVDLGLVDALARIQVAARRRGCAIRLREPDPELCELLDLVGLADLLAGDGEWPL